MLAVRMIRQDLLFTGPSFLGPNRTGPQRLATRRHWRQPKRETERASNKRSRPHTSKLAATRACRKPAIHQFVPERPTSGGPIVRLHDARVDEALRDVQTIRTLAAGLSRKRDGIYLLLMEIYRIGRRWIKSKHAKEMRDAVIYHENLLIDRRARKNVFRFLIEVGYPVKVTFRSRYTNALRYAHAHDCPDGKFDGFPKKRGRYRDVR